MPLRRRFVQSSLGCRTLLAGPPTPAPTAISRLSATGFLRFLVPLLAAEHIGAFVAPDKDTGNNLLDQQLIVVADAAHAIGVLAEEAAVGATSLTVRLKSFLLDGGFAS